MIKFFTNKVRYGILTGLAAYGAYHIVLNIIGIGIAIQNCEIHQEGTISVMCYVFGLN